MPTGVHLSCMAAIFYVPGDLKIGVFGAYYLMDVILNIGAGQGTSLTARGFHGHDGCHTIKKPRHFPLVLNIAMHSIYSLDTSYC